MFILRTALKYAFSKGKGQRTSSVVIVLGIALGLAALLVISSVMNGLQTAQLDQLRALESFDVSVEPSSGNDGLSLGLDDVSGIPGIDFAFEYIETYALVVDKTSGKSTSARVRAYSNDAYYSERMAQSLHFIAGEPIGMDGVAVSYTMMNTLSLHSGDDVEVTFLKPGRTATVVPYSTRMAIGALFGSSMTEFSSSTIFVDYQWLLSLMGESSVRIGIYTQNPESVASRIAELSPDSKAVTWKEYNRALYSALMLEKALMYIFLAFMFLIICVNLKNSTRRLLRNRQQEGAMLRALGCTRATVNSIFVLQGVLVCLIGEVVGVLLGTLAVNNLQSLLDFADTVARFFTGSATVLGFLQFQANTSPLEIMLSCGFVFILAVVFTYMGCRRTYRHEIMEVILNASY